MSPTKQPVEKLGHHCLCFIFVAAASSLSVHAWSGTSPSLRLQPQQLPGLTSRRLFLSNPGEDSDPERNKASNSLDTDQSASNSRRPGDEKEDADPNFQRQVRLAQAQAEIDKILNDPVDPPFDAESELQKVVSISPPLIPPGSPEYALEEEVSKMEEALYQAVKQQDLDTASRLSREISQQHLDDCGLVLQTLSQFYQAFSNKDIGEMSRVWLAADPSAVCIHPSLPPLYGSRSILHSWQRMFDSKSGSFQKSWVEAENVQLKVHGLTAVVTCDERVYTRRFVRGKQRQTERVNTLQATNIFRRVGSRWHLVYHHSSWHADSETAKLALRQRKNGETGSHSGRAIVDHNPSSDSIANRLAQGRSRILGRPTRREDGTQSNDSNQELDSILGIDNFGPLLGDDNNDKNSHNDGKPVQKIIMGSISDLVNGNLDDLFGGPSDAKNKGDQNGSDPLADLLGNINPNINLGNDSKQGSKKNGSGPSDAVIRFNRIEDDDYDEEYEDEDGDIEEIVEVQMVDQSPTTTARTSMMKSSETLKQECIGTLRNLASAGRISFKQKQLLLADIIGCSSRGETSMVEVAYDLLVASSGVGEAEVSDGASSAASAREEAEEEFADQCIVFVKSMGDQQDQHY